MSDKPTSDKGSPPPVSPPPVKMIEVDLLRKYCPQWLIDEDGGATANSTDVKKTIEPGIVKLHSEDATLVLRNGTARPTATTFKDI